MSIEYRSLRLMPGAVQGKYVAGYAARSGVESNDLGGYCETIGGRAFTNALQPGSTDTIATVNHDLNYLLARRSAGTLELGQDDFGLWFRILMPPTQLGADVLTQIARGDLNGCSFAMGNVRDSWSRTADGRRLRTINSIGSLADVSIVSCPAYPRTSVNIGQTPQVRSVNLDHYRLRLLEISQPR